MSVLLYIFLVLAIVAMIGNIVFDLKIKRLKEENKQLQKELDELKKK